MQSEEEKNRLRVLSQQNNIPIRIPQPQVTTPQINISQPQPITQISTPQIRVSTPSPTVQAVQQIPVPKYSSFGARLKDILIDANTPQDIAKRQNLGQPSSYTEQKLAQGERPVTNPLLSIAAGPIRTVNLFGAGIQQLPGLAKIAGNAVTGDKPAMYRAAKELEQTQKRVLSPTSGLFGLGTAIPSQEWLDKSTFADRMKVAAAYGAENASWIIGAKGLPLVKGLAGPEKLINLAKFASLESFGGGLAGAGGTVVRKPEASAKEIAISGFTGAVVAPVVALGAGAATRGISSGIAYALDRPVGRRLVSALAKETDEGVINSAVRELVPNLTEEQYGLVAKQISGMTTKEEVVAILKEAVNVSNNQLFTKQAAEQAAESASVKKLTEDLASATNTDIIKQTIKSLLPSLDDTQQTQFAGQIAKANTPEQVTRILDQAEETSRQLTEAVQAVTPPTPSPAQRQAEAVQEALETRPATVETPTPLTQEIPITQPSGVSGAAGAGGIPGTTVANQTRINELTVEAKKYKTFQEFFDAQLESSVETKNRTKWMEEAKKSEPIARKALEDIRALENKYLNKPNLKLTEKQKSEIDNQYKNLIKILTKHLDTYGGFQSKTGWVEGKGEGPNGLMDNFSMAQLEDIWNQAQITPTPTVTAPVKPATEVPTQRTPKSIQDATEIKNLREQISNLSSVSDINTTVYRGQNEVNIGKANPDRPVYYAETPDYAATYGTVVSKPITGKVLTVEGIHGYEQITQQLRKVLASYLPVEEWKKIPAIERSNIESWVNHTLYGERLSAQFNKPMPEVVKKAFNDLGIDYIKIPGDQFRGTVGQIGHQTEIIEIPKPKLVEQPPVVEAPVRPVTQTPVQSTPTAVQGAVGPEGIAPTTQILTSQVDKTAQFNVIKKLNPMTNEYNTGIRSVNDIKTFQEAFNDPESFAYPDFTKAQGQKALTEGKIFVYSSKPLDNNIAQFVTPSKMAASDYAGNGKIYSKEVNINDVAWINADEGQLVGSNKILATTQAVTPPTRETPVTQPAGVSGAAGTNGVPDTVWMLVKNKLVPFEELLSKNKRYAADRGLKSANLIGTQYNEGITQPLIFVEDIRTNKSAPGVEIIGGIFKPGKNGPEYLEVYIVDHTSETLSKRISILENRKKFLDGELVPGLQKELDQLYALRDGTQTTQVSQVAPAAEVQGATFEAINQPKPSEVLYGTTAPTTEQGLDFIRRFSPNRLIRENITRPAQDFINRLFAQAQVSKNALARGIGRLGTGFGREIGATPELIAARKRFLQGTQELGKVVREDVIALGNALSKTVNQRVWATLDPELAAAKGIKITVDDLTPEELAYRQKLVQYVDEVTAGNLGRGLINDEMAAKDWFKRGYKMFDFDESYNQGYGAGRADLGKQFKGRKDLSEEMIEQAIDDPAYLIGKKIADSHAAWGMVDYGNWLGKNGFVSDVPLPGYRQLRSSKIYGAASGKYVPANIAEDFTGFQFGLGILNQLNDVLNWYDNLGIRKAKKAMLTVLNPTVRMGNQVSNRVIFAQLGGINPVTFNKNFLRVKQLRDSRDPLYIEAVRRGLTGLDITQQEFTNKIAEYAGQPNLAKKAWNWVKSTYSGADDNAKIAAFVTHVERGYSYDEAARMAQRAFQDYKSVGFLYDIAAKVPIAGNAFVRFAGDSARILTNALVDNPLTLASSLAGIWALGEYMSRMSGETPDEKKTREERFAAPKIPFTNISLEIQTPWGAVNVARFMPYYNLNEIQGDLTKFLPFAGNPLSPKNWNDPLLGQVLQMLVDKDFRGKSIKEPENVGQFRTPTPSETANENRLRFALTQNLPLAREVDALYSAAKGKEDVYGGERSLGQAFGRVLGVKVEQFGPEQVEKLKKNEAFFADKKYIDDQLANMPKDLQEKYKKLTGYYKIRELVESTFKPGTQRYKKEPVFDFPEDKYKELSTAPELYSLLMDQKVRDNKRDGRPIPPEFDIRLSNEFRRQLIENKSLRPGDDVEADERMFSNPEWDTYQAIKKEYTAKAKAFYPQTSGEFNDELVKHQNAEFPEKSGAYKDYTDAYQLYVNNQGPKPEFTDAVKADKDKYNNDKLQWVNNERKARGLAPVSPEVWNNVTFGFTSDEEKVYNELRFGKGFGGFGGGFGPRPDTSEYRAAMAALQQVRGGAPLSIVSAAPRRARLKTVRLPRARRTARIRLQ